jgi:endonuclease/exonuclease/phosphatase family metal-dependent hydrolase
MNAKHIGIVISVTAIACFAGFATAKPLSITTWNAEHLMSEERFEEWKTFCGKLDWPDSRDQTLSDEIRAELKRKPKRLTYCNALGWPKAVRVLSDHKEKVASLRALSEQLQSDIYFFQEVSDAKAIQELINDKDYVSVSSFELLKDVTMPQNVGIAYRKGVFDKEPTILLNTDVMVLHESKSGEKRPVRPGIELHGSINGKELAFLNLHMKSSCHEYELDNTKADCQTYAKQVHQIEMWIEKMADAGKDFVLLGDFNRAFDIDSSYEARSDGGSAQASPTKESQTRSFLHEINDGNPDNVSIYYAPNVFVRKHSDWNCYEKIDRFFLNKTFAETIIWKTPELGLAAKGKNYPDFGKDKVKPSDHCPITLELPL